jgi:allophanate hydrolase subunit 2
VICGPEYDLLEDPAQFLAQNWTTTHGMSDMGIRLICPGANWPDLEQGSMVSGPINDGTVQLTPTGPIILLRQRATTGGYPRIFNVLDADIDVLGQYGPNQALHFREVTVEEARSIATRRQEAVERFRTNWARGE